MNKLEVNDELINSIDLRDIQRSIHRESFYEFFKDAFVATIPDGIFYDNWCTKYLCDTLQAEAERIYRKEKKEKDLILNVPVRFGKSLIISWFTDWVWSWWASATFVTISYDSNLAITNSLKTRDLINTEWYQNLYGDVFKLRLDANSVDDFHNDKGGFRKSFGSTQMITGQGGNFLLIDDPQNPYKLSSEIEKENIKKFWKRAYTRLGSLDIDVRVLIMQRLGDDLCAYLLENNPEKYNHICIPAILTDNVKPAHLKDNYVDGLFFPERFSQDVLDDLKVELGSKAFSNQLLQEATPEEGEVFRKDWFTKITKKEFYDKFKNQKITWNFFIDAANTSDKKNDATAIITCAKINNSLYIIDVKEVWFEFSDLVKFLKTHIPKYKTSNSKIYIENKANGTPLINILNEETPDLYIYPINPSGKMSKEQRIHQATPFTEAKRVYLIDDGNSRDIENFIDNVCAFPNGKRDDIVDAFAYAVNTKTTAPISFRSIGVK